MRVLGFVFLIVLMACGKTKESPVQTLKGEPMCGPKQQSLIESTACVPMGVWKIHTESNGFPDKISLNIGEYELFNQCESDHDHLKLELTEGSAVITIGFMSIPSEEQKLSLEIFNCEDGRRFAAADPAEFEINHDESTRIYTVRTELKKD